MKRLSSLFNVIMFGRDFPGEIDYGNVYYLVAITRDSPEGCLRILKDFAPESNFSSKSDLSNVKFIEQTRFFIGDFRRLVEIIC